MFTKLLSLKHWQLFLIYAILLILSDSSLISSFLFLGKSHEIITYSSYIGTFFNILFYVFFYGWLYTVVVNLHKKRSINVPMSLFWFKFLLFFSVAYLSVSFALPLLATIFPSINAVFLYLFYFMIMGDKDSVFWMYASFAIIKIILALPIISFILHGNTLAAKALKSAELQESVVFKDFIKEFFLMLFFFPIGIWFMQPRINKLFSPYR